MKGWQASLPHFSFHFLQFLKGGQMLCVRFTLQFCLWYLLSQGWERQIIVHVTNLFGLFQLEMSTHPQLHFTVSYQRIVKYFRCEAFRKEGVKAKDSIDLQCIIAGHQPWMRAMLISKSCWNIFGKLKKHPSAVTLNKNSDQFSTNMISLLKLFVTFQIEAYG